MWRYYRAHGRHDLPWRQTQDVYKILVSEVMLQQTQVNRVLPIYAEFTRRFPTARTLAAAPLSEVLKSWQGLGYNRRAKLLRETAQQLADTPSFGTRLNLVVELEKLPGVGPYTARAVAAFAYNQDSIVIETNIRTAIIQHFFAGKKKVSDTDIIEVLERILPKGRAREWYSALMDYGAHLKRSGISHTARSKTYTKQSKFSGSLREVRGAILRELAAPSGRKPDRGARQLIAQIEKDIGTGRHAQIVSALEALCTEGLVQKKRTRYSLAD